MIALNETNEYSAEVAFTLPLEGDPLTGLTGWTFALGEVQIKLPGQSWVNADLLKIVEKGYGRFCVRLTSAQCMVAGDVFVRAVVDGTQYYLGSDVIGLLGGDIQENSSTGSVSFYLPLATDPINGTPLTAYDWTESGTYTSTTPRVRVCFPDGAYQDADIALIETVGHGGFKLNLSASQTTKRGKVFVYALVPGYQRFEGYCTILGVGVAGGSTPTPPGPTPVPAPYAPDDPEYVNQVALGLNRLAEQFRSGDANYGTRNEPSVPLSEFLGEYTPNVVGDFEVEIPDVEVTVTNHLQQALNRLPTQFRSGNLPYNLPVTTTTEDVVDEFVPSSPSTPYEIEVPVVTTPGASSHVSAALERLPAQFRSSN